MSEVWCSFPLRTNKANNTLYNGLMSYMDLFLKYSWATTSAPAQYCCPNQTNKYTIYTHSHKISFFCSKTLKAQKHTGIFCPVYLHNTCVQQYMCPDRMLIHLITIVLFSSCDHLSSIIGIGNVPYKYLFQPYRNLKHTDVHFQRNLAHH